MILDINAYLGEFALRDLPHNTPIDLLRLMDGKGIDAALVSSAAAITWKDCQAANKRLHRDVCEHADRLVPCAVLNPAYAGWEHDLHTCVDELGMKGVKLYPHWHGYSLSDLCADAIVDAAADCGVPVLIPIRAVDRRQLGWLSDVPDVPLDDIATLVERHPNARFAVLNGVGFTGSRLVTARDSLPDNYWIEISRLSVFIGRELPHLIDALGPERLLFGTGMPFKYVDPVLLKMDKLGAPDSAKALIYGRNAEGLLPGNGQS